MTISHKSCCKKHFKYRARSRVESMTSNDVYTQVRRKIRNYLKGHICYDVYPIRDSRYKIILENCAYIVVFNEKLKQLVTIWPDLMYN